MFPVATNSDNTTSKSCIAPDLQIGVLAVGDWGKREFATATTDIHGKESWQTAADIKAARRHLADYDTPPDLILLAQSIPGEYRQADIDHLSDLAPLSRIIVVAGTWCEGEMRTGSPVNGTLRLYWYEFAPWWQAALRNLAAGLCPPWSLPLDNPQAGRYLAAVNTKSIPLTGTVVIEAADFTVYETLAAALANTGINAARSIQGDQSDLPPDTVAGIWDGGQLSPSELTRLTTFCKKIQAHNGKQAHTSKTNNGKIVALLDFPRLHHLNQIQAAGATTLFAKPYILEEVIAALQ